MEEGAEEEGTWDSEREREGGGRGMINYEGVTRGETAEG